MFSPHQSLVLLGTLVSLFSFGTRAIAQPNSSPGFMLPSKNIYCAYFEPEGDQGLLRCEMRSQLHPLPPKPANCELDWGGGLMMNPRGQVQVLCAGDTISADYPTLKYYQPWRKPGFRCLAKPAGLTCKAQNGRGFFLSRDRWYKI